MFYSHDGLGLGHFRRNLVLARTLSGRVSGSSVLLACSAEGIETFSLPAGVDVLRLPSLRKVGNGRYVGRRLRIEHDELTALRAGLLASAVSGFGPDVLIVDKQPLGIGGELLPALAELRRRGGRAALGLRDVLDDPASAAIEWRRGDLGRRAAELYDLALVYGSEGMLSPVIDGALPPELISRVRYCGYVVARPPTGAQVRDLPFGAHDQVVLATVGGGEDGFPVLAAFVEAARGARWRGVAIAGPQMANADWTRLHEAAKSAGVAAYQSVRQVQRWYTRAAALVCMGGYNTLVEALAAPVPTVCVPRTKPRREQLIRARAFAERELLRVVEPDALNPRSLRGAIDEAIATTRGTLRDRVKHVLDFGGAERAAALLIELAGEAAGGRVAAIQSVAQ
jgi:predicted glycosyltransferase